jgi:hypothetical protein
VSPIAPQGRGPDCDHAGFAVLMFALIVPVLAWLAGLAAV